MMLIGGYDAATLLVGLGFRRRPPAPRPTPWGKTARRPPTYFYGQIRRFPCFRRRRHRHLRRPQRPALLPRFPVQVGGNGGGHPGVLTEAVRRDARKGVAFKSRTLDDIEHGVFPTDSPTPLAQPDDARDRRLARPTTTPAMAISSGRASVTKATFSAI